MKGGRTFSLKAEFKVISGPKEAPYGFCSMLARARKFLFLRFSRSLKPSKGDEYGSEFRLQ